MSRRCSRPARACGLAILVLLIVGCSGTDRPSASEWEPTWSAAVATLPALEQLGDPPSTEQCGEALGQLREIRPALDPTPDPALDAVVHEWVQVAEDAMFECPPSSAELSDFAMAYGELARLQAEVDVVLEFEIKYLPNLTP